MSELNKLVAKIQNVKHELSKLDLKKSGMNAYAKFEYFELSDFTPDLIRLCGENKILTHVSFQKDYAVLTIFDTETSESLEYTSPMIEFSGNKGMNEMQRLGAIQTYQRRYLYFMAFDIIENDINDAVSGMHPPNPKQQQKKMFENNKNNIENAFNKSMKKLDNVLSNEDKEMLDKLENVKEKFEPKILNYYESIKQGKFKLSDKDREKFQAYLDDDIPF